MNLLRNDATLKSGIYEVVPNGKRRLIRTEPMSVKVIDEKVKRCVQEVVKLN